MQAQPNWVFGISWFALLILIGIAALVVWVIRSPRRLSLLIPFLVVIGVLLLTAGFYLSLHVPQGAEATAVALPANAVAEISNSVPLEISQAAEGAAPAEPQPTWVGQGTTINGERVFSVTAGPHANDALCEKELTPALRQRVDQFIDDFIGEPGAARRVQLDMTYIYQQLVKERSFETTQHSFGPMRNLHVRVVIDRAAQDFIRRQYHTALVNARLGYTAGAFGLLLVLLGTAFGYLKLDTATKGYYSGRLKLAATAVILTAAAATALVVRQADPAAQWPVGFPARESPQVVNF